MTRPSPICFVLAICLLASSLTGCDEAIEPRPEIEQTYTLWGAFDPTLPQQAVRVVRISDMPRLGSGETLDVEVTSVNLDNDEVTNWRDSLVSFRDGSQGRIYMADTQPAFGSQHEFRVVPAQSPPVTVFIPVPPVVEPSVAPGESYPGDVRYRIAWPKAPQLNEIQLTYLVKIGNGPIERLTFPFPGEAVMSEEGWTLTLRLEQDAVDLRDLIRLRPQYQNLPLPIFILHGLQIDVDVASETWSIPSVVRGDKVLRIQPDAFTNVTNGYGFVGASYAASVAWEPEAKNLLRTRSFRAPPPSSSGAGLAPAGL